jgi:hypothetical protein
VFELWLALAWSTELLGTGESNRPAVTVDNLPDDICREIFASCLLDLYPDKNMDVWQCLVHVCPRWRRIIFASPRYFDLQLYCSPQTPFRENISHWPEFPLTVCYGIPEDEDDLIAALEHPDRVRRVELLIESSKVEEAVAAMQVPFPVLTQLDLFGPEYDALALPDGFLGGSAPCLQHLHFRAIAFPELPTLLLSACDLVFVELKHIPPTGYGYILPEAMVGGLAALTKLRTLCIAFPSPTLPHGQGRRSPDPPMMAVLPALTTFDFEGDSEYLEDLVARIDAPRVDNVRIEYCVEEVQTRQLSQFIGRSANLAKFGRAELTIDYRKTCIILDHPQGECHQGRLSLTFQAREVGFPVPCMIDVLGQLVPMLSNVRHLSVLGEHLRCRLRGECGPLRHHVSWEWLPLLRPFRAVEALHASGGLEEYIGCALEEIDEDMVTVVLPALRLLWLYDDRIGDDREALGSIERFLSLRQLSGRPVTMADTEDEFDELVER